MPRIVQLDELTVIQTVKLITTICGKPSLSPRHQKCLQGVSQRRIFCKCIKMIVNTKTKDATTEIRSQRLMSTKNLVTMELT